MQFKVEIDDEAGTSVWRNAGETAEGLQVECERLAVEEPHRVEAMDVELQQIDQFLAAGAATTTTTATTSTTTTPPAPPPPRQPQHLVDGCVEYVNWHVGVGDSGAPALWDQLGRSAAELHAACETLAKEAPDAAQGMVDEMNEIEAYLAAAAAAPPATPSGCDPNYSGCVPIDSDVDCAGGSGNGPSYTGPTQVIGRDIYDLDRDNDGLACE